MSKRKDDRTLLRDIGELYRETTGLFHNLAAVAGLDPKFDFRERDLTDFQFAGADLRGFDFTRSDLRGTAVRRAANLDSTTILSGAKIDDQDRRWIRTRKQRLSAHSTKAGGSLRAPAPETREAAQEISEATPSLRVLAFSSGTSFGKMLSADTLRILEPEVLPDYLMRQRWFASKDEQDFGVTIAYAVRLPTTRGAVALVEINVELPSRTERYALPLGLIWDDEQADPLVQQLALCRVKRGSRYGLITDASAADAFTHGMISGMHSWKVLPTEDGELNFRPTPLIQRINVPLNTQIRRLSTEASHPVWIVGRQVVLKLCRRVLPGNNPEGEMSRFLTEHGFLYTTPLIGDLVRLDEMGTPHTIALMHGFVPNQGDGWGWTLEFLARLREELRGSRQKGSPDVIESARQKITGYEPFARSMGTRLAELHALLSRATDDPAFAPENPDANVLNQWGESAIANIDAAVILLSEGSGSLVGRTKQQALDIVGNADQLREAARHLASQGEGALLTRLHTDFHLGQVLNVKNDAFIIDFEGEPARPLESRLAKSSALRDVAGMLRSFHYAAAAADRATSAITTSPGDLIATSNFYPLAYSCFLDAYRGVLNRAEPRWVSQASEEPLLDLFLLEKIAYEVRYEATYRPDWLSVPLGSMHTMARRLLNVD